MNYTTLTASMFPNQRHGDVLYLHGMAGAPTAGIKYVVSRRVNATELRLYPFTWWRWAWYRVMRIFYR